MDRRLIDNQLTLFADGSLDAVFVILDGKFSYLNNRALKLFGADTAEQLVGHPVASRILKPPVSPVTVNMCCDEYGCERNTEQIYRRLDGSTIEVEVSCVQIGYDDDLGCLIFARDISRRKKADQEVQKLNQQLEEVLNRQSTALFMKESELSQAMLLNESILMYSSSGVILYHSDGQCILANPAAAVLVGCTPEDLLSQNFNQLDSWKNSGLLDMAKRVLKTRQPESLDAHLITTFGREFWGHFQFSSFSNMGVQYLMLIVHDISELKQAEKELSEREILFRTLAENVPDNIARYDLEGRTLYINPTLERTMGQKAEDVSGLKSTEITSPKVDIKEYEKTILKVAHTQQPAEYELSWIGHQDEPQHHLIRMVPEFDLNGDIVSVLAVGRDLTKLKMAQDELKLAASVFHNSAEGVMITDAQGKFVSINPAFTEITGYTEKEVCGQTPRLMRSNRQDDAFYQKMWEDLTTNGEWKGELWNRRKSGEAYLIWNTINRIDDDQGNPVRYVSVFHDITELRRKEEHIHQLAFHDALTGIPNRILFIDRLKHAIDLAERNQSRLSVILFDLDRFKNVNDGLGHDMGDQLLQEIAQRVKHRLRATDTVARLYGDEFVIVTEEVDSTDSCAFLAEELLLEISRPVDLKGQTVTVGASFGIALYPDDGDNYLELLKHADMAMYAAKAAGRNVYRFFQSNMLERASKRLSMEMSLREAISKGGLELYYQPKINLNLGTPQSVEALVRWRHPKLGVMSPSDFIPLAEECGLISDLGAWVMNEACRQVAEWRKMGHNIKVAFNVSPRQLDDDDIASQLAGMTEDHGIPPNLLEIELTESTVMQDPKSVIKLLSRLRELGVSLAVDDFGTGYSSLAYLRRLPLDVLKIDRSFIKAIENSEEDAQIVKTIIALGRALKLNIVAEGIENEHQANILRWLGCPVGQGYYFSKPIPARELHSWLERFPADPTLVDPADFG